MLVVNTPDSVHCWHIPRLVKKSHPSFKSVYNLLKYKYNFTDLEVLSKYRFVNCIPGWWSVDTPTCFNHFNGEL